MSISFFETGILRCFGRLTLSPAEIRLTMSADEVQAMRGPLRFR